MYPDPRVAAFINEHFVPDRAHVKEQATVFHRFGARWTPTVLVLDPDGREVRRIEGFLPADELLGQLDLALGYEAANHKKWANAEGYFEAAVDDFPATDAAPEGLYWAGVARYSASHDAAELRQVARAFKERYTDTGWAKRSTVWRAE